MLSGRLRNEKLKERIVNSNKASSWIKNGMTIGFSGFTGGDAKAIPAALAERVKEEDKPFKIKVYTGASTSPAVDGVLADAGIVELRIPYQSEKRMNRLVNSGTVKYVDQHLSHTAEMIRSGALPPIDIAVIEATAITEEGHIIPSSSVGNSNIFAQYAREIIVELNLAQPIGLEGLHDIYDPGEQGSRKPLPIITAGQRIGTKAIVVNPDKIKGIVVTNRPEKSKALEPPDDETNKMARFIIDFLRQEVQKGHLPPRLTPLQFGVGSVGNAVCHGFLQSEFKDLEVYSEVLQDSIFDLLDAGKVCVASGCSLTLSTERRAQVYAKLDSYKERVVLRPQEMSNNPGIIRRLGVISMNTALEVDIYGNVNSTHVAGSRMMNGIGGSGDFARSARLTIFCTKSYAREGKVSSIVPMASHVDHTEHDVDVIVTEQGLADLRGLHPRGRAVEIIEKCAHPSYRPKLQEYYQEALSRGGHTPHVLEKALSWHIRLLQEGTMQ
ncbi:MAG: acetyl-CoA hydrolase [Peptococcaceae bacterium BICA1-7]|nr:MAG: acetyl-CoA hydrolase [Peptococcaceae bacterium BICA1-7]HBV98321.1 succinate CoA transferase [Desulfotomaculum sp.]